MYGAAALGIFVVNRNNNPRWAVILLCAAVLALGGCGRKGPLDLPPNSTAPPAAAVQGDTDQTSKSGLFGPTNTADEQPTAAKGRKRPFVLDPLLDSGR